MHKEENNYSFNLAFKDRNFKLAVIAVIMLVLIQIVASFYFSGNETGQMIFGDIFNIVVDAFVIMLLVYTFFKSIEYGKLSSKGWGILGISTLIWLIADLAYAIMELYFGDNPFPSIADVFYIAYYPLFAIGILLFPRERFSAEDKVKFIIDALIITFSLGLIFWIFLINPAIASSSGYSIIETLVSTGYVNADFIIFIAALGLLFAGSKELNQKTILLIIASVLIAIICDSLYVIQSIQGTYVSGGLLDVGWLLQNLLIGLAAIFQVAQWKNDDFQTSKMSSKYQSNFFSYFPIFFAIASYSLIIWTYYNTPSTFEIALFVNAFIMVLVLIRQKISISETLETVKGIFGSSPDAILITTLQGVITDANPAALEIYGFSSKEEIIQYNIFDFVKKEDKRSVAKSMETIIRDGRIRDVEFNILRITGEEFPGNMSIGISYDISGNPTSLITIIKDISEQKNTENIIKSSLKEKERLLREIHHRVKNNLQIVVSLLSLQSEFIGEKEASEILQDSEIKVRSMAMVHKLLYQTTDLSKLDFREYVGKLGTNILNTYSRDNIQLDVNAKDIYLDTDTAIPCGLIITELITNSLKYAFPDGKYGTISISMERKQDDYILTVSDDGVGISEDSNSMSSDGIGLNLVNSLVMQLEGELQIDVNNGTKFTIEFPNPEVFE